MGPFKKHKKKEGGDEFELVTLDGIVDDNKTEDTKEAGSEKWTTAAIIGAILIIIVVVFSFITIVRNDCMNGVSQIACYILFFGR